MSKDRLQILEMIQAGQISTEEALKLIEDLDEADRSELMAMEGEQETSRPVLPGASNWWLYPTAAGAVVMALGAPLLALGITGQAAIFWAVFCGWIPFFFGLAILTLGVWSRGARWLHLRINNTRSGKRTIALSVPLPLTLSAWVLRMLRHYVPSLDGTAIDEIILALRDGLGEQDDEPVFINVQDDEDGEHVMMYIG